MTIILTDRNECTCEAKAKLYAVIEAARAQGDARLGHRIAQVVAR